jgi:hypothetical protein
MPIWYVKKTKITWKNCALRPLYLHYDLEIVLLSENKKELAHPSPKNIHVMVINVSNQQVFELDGINNMPFSRPKGILIGE